MVEHVFLYRSPTAVGDVDAVAEWLEPRIDAPVIVRDRFLAGDHGEELPEKFVRARVRSPTDPETGNTMLGTVRYE